MFGNNFKVGDRVEFIEDYGTHRKAGHQGVVKEVERHGEYLTTLHMDLPFGHSGHTCWAFARRLRLVAPVAPKQSITDHIGLVVETADKVFPRRSLDTIFKSLMEETGELSTEISIAQGEKKRLPSPDGVKGEAVDVFIVAVDMLRATWGKALFTEEFTDKVKSKLAKWEGK